MKDTTVISSVVFTKIFKKIYFTIWLQLDKTPVKKETLPLVSFFTYTTRQLNTKDNKKYYESSSDWLSSYLFYLEIYTVPILFLLKSSVIFFYEKTFNCNDEISVDKVGGVKKTKHPKRKEVVLDIHRSIIILCSVFLSSSFLGSFSMIFVD